MNEGVLIPRADADYGCCVAIQTPGLGLSVHEDRSALSGYPGNKLPDQWTADEKHEDFQPGECSGLTIFKTSIPAQRGSVDWEDFTTGRFHMLG